MSILQQQADRLQDAVRGVRAPAVAALKNTFATSKFSASLAFVVTDIAFRWALLTLFDTGTAKDTIIS